MVNKNYLMKLYSCMVRPDDCTCLDIERIAYEWDMTHDKNMVEEEEPFKL